MLDFLTNWLWMIAVMIQQCDHQRKQRKREKTLKKKQKLQQRLNALPDLCPKGWRQLYLKRRKKIKWLRRLAIFLTYVGGIALIAGCGAIAYYTTAQDLCAISKPNASIEVAPTATPTATASTQPCCSLFVAPTLLLPPIIIHPQSPAMIASTMLFDTQNQSLPTNAFIDATLSRHKQTLPMTLETMPVITATPGPNVTVETDVEWITHTVFGACPSKSISDRDIIEMDEETKKSSCWISWKVFWSLFAVGLTIGLIGEIWKAELHDQMEDLEVANRAMVLNFDRDPSKKYPDQLMVQTFEDGMLCLNLDDD